MRLLKIVMPVVLLAGLVCAQEKPPADNGYDAVIIPVKTLTGDSFDRLVKLLQVFQVRMQSDEKLRTIVVYAPRDVVDKMRKVIAELDQPSSEAAIGRNIDMTLTFLKASTKAATTPSTLPADMEAVAKQLRANTQYKDIQLWDTLPLHLQEGKETQETLRLPSGNAIAAGYSTVGQVNIRPEGVTRKDSGRFVRFSTVRISFRVPYATGSFNSGTGNAQASTQYQYMEVGLTTSGDFMEGQKTVLGKVSGVDDETSFFVVISLKVLD
ncbi:MAG TPA: hypothetical protein VGN17_06275 [Bryobacteraceae bacterium]|jgi:hypothetical protein